MENEFKISSYVENGTLNTLKFNQNNSNGSNKSPSDKLLGDRRHVFYHKRTAKAVDVAKRKARSGIFFVNFKEFPPQEYFRNLRVS